MRDLQSTKFEQRPQIFEKLSFRELRHSKLSGLQAFEHGQNSLSLDRLKTKR